MKEKFEALVDHLFTNHIFLSEAVEILERGLIQRAIQASGGNQCAASKQLGIHRNTLQRKMVEYGLASARRRVRRRPAGRAGRTSKRKSAVA